MPDEPMLVLARARDFQPVPGGRTSAIKLLPSGIPLFRRIIKVIPLTREYLFRNSFWRLM
jgi:hypothetical protein